MEAVDDFRNMVRHICFLFFINQVLSQMKWTVKQREQREQREEWERRQRTNETLAPLAKTNNNVIWMHMHINIHKIFWCETDLIKCSNEPQIHLNCSRISVWTQINDKVKWYAQTFQSFWKLDAYIVYRTCIQIIMCDGHILFHFCLLSMFK